MSSPITYASVTAGAGGRRRLYLSTPAPAAPPPAPEQHHTPTPSPPPATNMDDPTSLLPPFFTPSYLRSSRHMHRLRKAHSARLQELREQNPPTAAPSPTSHTNPAKLPLASHSYHRPPAVQDIVERLPPPALDTDTPHPLPSRWSPTDRQSGLELLAHGSEVRFNGITKSTDEAASVRSDYPMPRECGIYYFEVSILSRHKDGLIGVGFSSKKANLNRLPGWEGESWAYHGDDGYVFACTASGKAYGPRFAREDVVGCGVDFRRGEAFFTRNGGWLGTAFTNIKTDRLYPSVGMKKPSEHLRVNFGQRPFVFDIDSLVEKQRFSVLKDINLADVGELHPPDDENALIQNLVGQYLAHEGYVETAKAFGRDRRERSARVTTLSTAEGEGGETEDDVHAVNRQRIRRAILDGEIEKAEKFLGSYYPRLWDDERNRDCYFRLRVRGFVEMVRRVGEVRRGEVVLPADDEGGDGEEGQDTQMELDDQLQRESSGGGDDRDGDEEMEEEEQDDDEGEDPMETSRPDLLTSSSSKLSQIKAAELEQQALAYGAELQEEFGGADAPMQVRKVLGDCFAVLAYEDWRDSPVSHLFMKDGRGAVAEGVNGAVLVSLGKPSSAALEKVCAQTEALLDESAGKNGGSAAFVFVERDFLRG